MAMTLLCESVISTGRDASKNHVPRALPFTVTGLFTSEPTAGVAMMGFTDSSEDERDEATTKEEEDDEDTGVVVEELGMQAVHARAKAETTMKEEDIRIALLCSQGAHTHIGG